ncbi:MAG: peptidase MA family metallohydrolase [Dehalococcoidia bacterium]|nr:peptidase MA family metallohydrolase [Dehalococcoidia bacterium]
MAPSAARRGGRLKPAPVLAALLLTALVFMAQGPAGPPASAQTAPAVTDGGVQNNFPQGMAFSVSARSDAPIEKVRLRYKILPDGTAAIGQPEFTSGVSVTASFELEGNNPPKIYLPPGTIIEYHWEVTDAAGRTAQTETKSFFYDDIRFDWNAVSISDITPGGVTIYYYSGSEDDARAMLSVAAQTFTAMSQLLGAQIGFPVKVWTYDSVEDMRPALARRSETFEQNVITAGTRVASDTVLVLGNVSFDTLRHELTHVVTAVAGESAFGTLPAWLDEGTAVYGQEDPGGFRSAVERAINRGSVLSVRSISSYPGEPEKVDLFYGEAWSLVKYLNDTYGQEQFAQLFAAIKKGKRIDAALQSVYGFGQDGLEDRWRAANGLPQRETPEPTQPQATQTPAVSGGGSGRPAAGDSGGTSTATIIALAAAVLALAGVVGFAGLIIARRFR